MLHHSRISNTSIDRIEMNIMAGEWRTYEIEDTSVRTVQIEVGR